MGELLFGSTDMTIRFDDRALTHVQVVITAKLRRKESFLFSWTDAPEDGSGRWSIWLDPSSVLYYRFTERRVPFISRVWIDVLMESANSSGGLIFTPEPTHP